MVCVPCIILPILLAIYLKFIQPLILRFVPEAWKNKLDGILYPTCPVKAPPSKKKENTSENQETSENAAQECACGDAEKKEN